MKLYHFASPNDYSFAQAIRRGTWYPKGAKLCPECNTSRQKRVSPILIEWEVGSNMIGDFVWPGFNSDLVVVQKVKESFEIEFNQLEFGPVEFVQTPKTKYPKKITSRTKLQVLLPYEGPRLWDVIPKVWCHLDHQRSNITIEKECKTCGKTIYSTPPWDQRKMIVDVDTWNGENIFRIYEYTGLIFCTERVKEFVNEQKFTNVSFVEDGVIPI